MWSEHRLLSFDGTPLFYLRLKPASKPKVAVIFVHGLGEYGERYRHAAEHLAQNGAEVFILDLRGFGRSGGRRAFIQAFSEYHKDLDVFHRFTASESKGIPVFMVAHSLGGLIASSYAAFTKHPTLAGMILSSPCFGLEIKVPRWKHFLAILASYPAPGITIPTGIDPYTLTHDKEMIERYIKDPLIIQRISLALYREMDFMMRKMEDIAKRMECPVLVLQAGDDSIVSKKQTFLFYDNLTCAPKEIEMYGGFFHEVLNETNRPAVLNRILVWIRQVMSPNHL